MSNTGLDKHLLKELEERISKIFEYTLNNIEEELTASELDIQQIIKEFEGDQSSLLDS
tara:strand:- start:609 stop:782 length:174 start_codon:yes stop_codon:yes gene_type:complete